MYPIWSNTFIHCTAIHSIPLTNGMLHEYLDDFVVVFLDDILIYSQTEEDHERHLSLVLDSLRKNQFYAKLKKCAF
jgi:hypothetical protein